MSRNEIRPICAIAIEIRAHWEKPSQGAKPYLDRMYSLTSMECDGMNDPEMIVLGFLSNARTFRGEKAIELKTELKNMIKGV